MPEILDIIFSRRSIRQFTPESVDHETLVLLLKAAMAAPTACNSQPWEFIVVTRWQRYEERKRRSKITNAKYLS